jgi:hypothetical protein
MSCLLLPTLDTLSSELLGEVRAHHTTAFNISLIMAIIQVDVKLK